MPESPRRRSEESGFALLLVLFMMLLLLIASTAAVSDLRTEKRRQREEEMVWRGNQYVRAIRLYYHKTGHYPQNLDDLQKGLPDLHFLRYATYKDPINTNGGEWRFIYVNAAGQIIGSVKYASLQQMALMDLNGGQLPGASSALLGALSMSPFAPAPNTAAPSSGTCRIATRPEFNARHFGSIMQPVPRRLIQPQGRFHLHPTWAKCTGSCSSRRSPGRAIEHERFWHSGCPAADWTGGWASARSFSNGCSKQSGRAISAGL